MPTTANDPDLAVLALADPAVDLQLDSGRARFLLAQVLEADTATQARRHRQRWRRRATRTGVGLVVTALAGTGIAWGGGWLTETGVYGAPGQTENDTSQWLNVLAPDFVDYAVTLWPDGVPLPAGYDQAALAQAIAAHEQQVSAASAAELGPSGQPAATAVWQQVTGVQVRFAAIAQCAWMAQWTSAVANGDDAVRDRALTVLTQSVAWAPLVAADGGGVEAQVETAVTAAARGDNGPLTTYYVEWGCAEAMANLGAGQ